MYLKVLKYLTEATSLYMSLMWPMEVSHHNIDCTEDGWSTLVSLQHCPVWKTHAQPGQSTRTQTQEGKADSSDPSLKDFKLAVQMEQMEGRASSQDQEIAGRTQSGRTGQLPRTKTETKHLVIYKVVKMNETRIKEVRQWQQGS